MADGGPMVAAGAAPGGGTGTATAPASGPAADRTPAPVGGGPAAPGSLRRDLSRRQLRMIGVGGAVGTGLFLGSGQAISTAGPAVMVAYLLGGVVSVVLAYTLAKMIMACPEVAGFGGLAERFLGAGVAFAQRWWYWLAQVVNIGGECLAAAIYLRLWWPELPLWLPVIGFAVLILSANALAVRAFGEVEYWFSMIKVVAIVVFVGLGLVAIFFGLPGQPATGVSAWVDHGGFAPHGIAGIWLAMVVVMFSYMGTETMAVAAGEARNARRDILAATRGVVFRLVLFYVLGTAVVVSVVPWTAAATYGSVDVSPFVKLFQTAGVPVAVHLVNCVVLTAALSAMNTNVYVTSRTLHGLAASGQAYRGFARLSANGVPHRALAASGLGLLLAALVAAVAPGRAFLTLVGLSLSGAILTWILIFATFVAFERRGGFTGRGRALALGAGAAIVLLAGVLVTMVGSEDFGTPVLSALPVLAAVAVVGWLRTRTHRRADRPG